MFRKLLLASVAAASLICLLDNSAQAQSPRGRVAQWASPYTVTDYWARNYASNRPWHGQYYYLQYGQPTALVVPPVAMTQTVHSWGVSHNTMHPIYHQFGRPYPVSPAGGVFYGTPPWPSHSDQFGVYPVRAPW